MEKTEIAAIIAIVYGLLEAVKLLTKALIDKKNGVKPQPVYKHDFLEKLGEAFDSLTKSLNEMRQDVKEIKVITVAVDPTNNFPKIWNDSPQQKRTHDAVNNLVDLGKEEVELLAEIHQKVKHA